MINLTKNEFWSLLGIVFLAGIAFGLIVRVFIKEF